MEPVPSTSKAFDVSNAQEFLYKILVIGELGTGKTALIKRYVHQFFSEHYRATIGTSIRSYSVGKSVNNVTRINTAFIVNAS